MLYQIAELEIYVQCEHNVATTLLLIEINAFSLSKVYTQESRVLSRIFCLGGKSILEIIFESRGGGKKIF